MNNKLFINQQLLKKKRSGDFLQKSTDRTSWAGRTKSDSVEEQA
jgi:hypothetical protein